MVGFVQESNLEIQMWGKVFAGFCLGIFLSIFLYIVLQALFKIWVFFGINEKISFLYSAIKSVIKKYFPYLFDLICFCGGSYYFVEGFFGFWIGGIGGCARRSGCGAGWSHDEQFSMAIGVVLIVLGFLIRSWRKNSQ